MIDEQSSASGHDYASDRSAIGAGKMPTVDLQRISVTAFSTILFLWSSDIFNSISNEAILDALLEMSHRACSNSPINIMHSFALCVTRLIHSCLQIKWITYYWRWSHTKILHFENMGPENTGLHKTVENFDAYQIVIEMSSSLPKEHLSYANISKNVLVTCEIAYSKIEITTNLATFQLYCDFLYEITTNLATFQLHCDFLYEITTNLATFQLYCDFL